jgi:adenylylsulfate kinase
MFYLFRTYMHTFGFYYVIKNNLSFHLISISQLEHIFPIFEKQLSRRKKEKLLEQRGMVIWFTGLSGAGKSTIAIALEKELYKMGYFTMLLDGDNMRSGLSKDLGFTPMARMENTRRAAEIAKMALNNGIITICSFVSGTNKTRRMVKRLS